MVSVSGCQRIVRKICLKATLTSNDYRVILDEAQCIKNKDTRAAKAAIQLEALSRFCMSGTPMMNSVNELYSLIHFLRIKPYNAMDKFRAVRRKVSCYSSSIC